jgi:hypothetical protein
MLHTSIAKVHENSSFEKAIKTLDLQVCNIDVIDLWFLKL